MNLKNTAKELLGKTGFLTGPLLKVPAVGSWIRPIHQKIQKAYRLLHHTRSP